LILFINRNHQMDFAMRQVTLTIPDAEYAFFMKLVKSLRFVKVDETKPGRLEDQLTPEQQKTWKNIKQGFEEYKSVEQGKETSRPINELLNEL
jgi:hypothetical protein